MSYDAIAAHLAARKSLRLFPMEVDDQDATKYHIIPEDFDTAATAAGSVMLVRMINAISGAGNTLDISPTLVNTTPIVDIPIELGGRELEANTINAFELMDDGNGGLECHLISIFNIFSLEDAIEAIQELGFSIVKDAGVPVGVEADYKFTAKGGLEVQTDQKTRLSDEVYITPNTKVYIQTEQEGIIDAGFFVTTETITTLIDSLIDTQLQKLVIRDERTPQEYEFQENVELPNGTIYYQLNAVVTEE